MKNFIFLSIFAASLFACSNPPADTTKATGEPQSFGAPITADGAITYAQLAPQLASVDSMPAKIRGTVVDVCQKKGCWMNVNDASAPAEMFVKFKDYGFFMPFDIAGREVIMEGYAYREVTSVEELKHYAEDEKKPQAEIDAITEPKEELKFMASGVLLLPQTKQ